MLAPWECLEAVAKALVPGGIVCAYVATTTSCGPYRRGDPRARHFNEPAAWENHGPQLHVRAWPSGPTTG